jgi:hypothetical protein
VFLFLPSFFSTTTTTTTTNRTNSILIIPAAAKGCCRFCYCPSSATHYSSSTAMNTTIPISCYFPTTTRTFRGVTSPFSTSRNQAIAMTTSKTTFSKPSLSITCSSLLAMMMMTVMVLRVVS